MIHEVVIAWPSDTLVRGLMLRKELDPEIGPFIPRISISDSSRRITSGIQDKDWTEFFCEGRGNVGEDVCQIYESKWSRDSGMYAERRGFAEVIIEKFSWRQFRKIKFCFNQQKVIM